MKREFLTTGDGSVTIHLPDWNEQYHSKHGAIAEARHVFLKMGLNHFLEKHPQSTISVLEIGFGTGLNALLTFLALENQPVYCDYTGVENFPVVLSEVEKLNYASLLNTTSEQFLKLHESPWETKEAIAQNFRLTKHKKLFQDISEENKYHLIYYDAFGARVQPELWTESLFLKMHNALEPEGVLVTYAAKGSVRRAMQAVGFTVERLPGPPGKREMLRATKHS